ncbi:MAG: BlaI/MecI/CopY family transcriptional regulator [Aeriscardovia sp.]|nr:BlaI/MecI/CopY family transcriptional regulator [Aeriscardovia sp.]
MFHGVLSESELLLMKYLWEDTEKGHSGIVFANIMNYTQNQLGKIWKKQTVNTFLSRLKSKNYIAATPSGGKCEYTPIISRTEYFKSVAKKISPGANLDFPNCILDSLATNQPLTYGEKEEILEFIDSL